VAHSWPCLPWRRDRATAAELGRRAERAAERFLERRGLRTMARNYRTRMGEIDLIMLDGEELVFVEVRFRSNERFGGGAATVDPRKQRRLVRAAEHYLMQRRKADSPCRFDVVSVAKTHYRLCFDWIPNAFTP
jgi:putative endonuclease